MTELEFNEPIICAGNITCREEVMNILRIANKTAIAVDNVYPRIDELDIEPARLAIYGVFEEQLVHALA